MEKLSDQAVFFQLKQINGLLVIIGIRWSEMHIDNLKTSFTIKETWYLLTKNVWENTMVYR